MKSLTQKLLGIILAATITGCTTFDPPAKPTPEQTGNLPTAIADANKEANDALAMANQLSSLAAASVAAIQVANSNQAAGHATTFIDRESTVALENLPSPSPQALEEANKRKLALYADRVEEADKLYRIAEGNAAKLRQEVVDSKAKMVAAQTALLEAERKQAAQLEANRLENQLLLDAARKQAEDAKQIAYKERQNLIFYVLIGIGGFCILAGIGLAIATSGASIGRSGIAVGCGGICFGLAKVISHPWFNTVFTCACIFIIAGVVAYFWYERKHAIKTATATQTLEHVVAAVEDVRKSSPDIDKVLTAALDEHTSKEVSRPEYIRLKQEVG